jgi:hypothetical protein
MRTRALARETVAPLLSGLLSFSLLLVVFRHGIYSSPDGWAYWQGSVSLLHGAGYSYFYQHVTIWDWPPGYSIYLMFFESIFGVSGQTLGIANATLGGLAAFGWCWCGISVLSEYSLEDRWTLLLASILISTVIVVENWQDFRSENLAYALLPLFVVLVLRTTQAKSGGQAGWFSVGTGVIGAALMVTRNADIAFIGAAIILIGTSPLMAYQKCTSIAIVVLTSFIPWFMTEKALGQIGSHPVHFGAGKYSPIQYLQQIVLGFGYALWNTRQRLGLLVFIFCASAIAFLLRRPNERNVQPRSSSTFLLLFVGLSLAFLFLLFNVTRVGDLLSGRFITFAAIAVLLVMAQTAANRLARWAVVLGTCLIMLPASTDVVRAVAHGTDWRLKLGTLIEPTWELKYAVVNRGPIQDGRLTIISPPVYPWIIRKAEGLPVGDE